MVVLVLITLLLVHLWVFQKLRNGVKRVIADTKSEHLSQLKISVVVPFRNEENHLSELVHLLNTQTIASQYVEFVFVNDNSTDDSLQTLSESIRIQRFKYTHRIISLTGQKGKKRALFEGVKNAQNETIVQLDADCKPNSFWLEEIQSHFKEETDLLILPVSVEGNNHHWFQQLEFSALQFITFGMGGISTPVLSNGANLAYKKNTWMESFKDLKNGDSGDDVFLLQSFIEKKRTIQFRLNKQLVVSTSPERNFHEFISQRLRWAGKNRNVNIPKYKLAMLYFGFSHAISFVLLMQNVTFATIYFIIKIIIEFTQLRWFRSRYETKTGFIEFLFAALIMPFYLIFISLISLFYKPKWKGRKVVV